MNVAHTYGNTSSSAIVFTELQACLILTFPNRLTDALTARIESETLARCAARRREAAIFDLSALEVIDLTEWDWLHKVASGILLLGAKTWFVGLKPPIIATLVTLDAKLEDVNYALRVEDALADASHLDHAIVAD